MLAITIRTLLDRVRASATHQRSVRRVSQLSFSELCCALEVVESGGVYHAEEIEETIWDMVYSPIFTDGTIVRLRFPDGTSHKVRERVTQIHAEVCARWDCDPSWSRDPKA